VSHNKFRFDGLEELRQALRTLPDDLANEAGVIVQAHAYTAAAAIRAAYEKHRRAGELADHVVVETPDHGRFGVGMIVRSKGRNAFLFEKGSEARHYITVNNVRHVLGRMPATPTFVPIMMDFRRSMWLELAEMLRAHGLVVTGTVDRVAA